MRLSRVAGKFCKAPVFGFDPDTQTWLDLGFKGSLQAYDRFITERSFGQKKRTLVALRETLIPERISQVRVGDDLQVYLVENLMPDMAENVYLVVYTLRQAAYEATLCRLEGQTRLSGVSTGDQEVELGTFWVDLERYSSSPSRTLDAIDYTTFTAVLPRDSEAEPGDYLKIGEQRYKVEEVYPMLELPNARVVRYE